jgi:hypothetical protein
MVAFLAALGGATVGGLITWLFALWRTVVEGQAAARAIRFELTGNVAELELASKGNWQGIELLDEAWRQHRLAVAPLLNEVELGLLWRDVSGISRIRRLLQAPLGTSGVGQALMNWEAALISRRLDLRKIESRSRWALVIRMIFCRWVRSKEEIAEAFLPHGTTGEEP